MEIKKEGLSGAHIPPDWRAEDFERLCAALGRVPSEVETAVAGVMWSEHCGYLHSRKLLQNLPVTGAALLQGPGENAGAVALDAEWALVFKMESHNHPSMVEPFQGSATGAGGILRDIFAMGARPALLMDGLSFGSPERSGMKLLATRVVAGLAHYGNSIGVPIVGGNLQFDPGFDGSILVNVLAAGFVPRCSLMRSSGARPGEVVVYYGNLTGRDGLGGAGFASDELSGDSRKDRFSVQIGDPYCGRRVMEATLELTGAGLPSAVQDMGAAGLTSSSVELAAASQTGIDLDLAAVPCREEGLSVRELLLSESQERMLLTVSSEKLPAVLRVLEKWELPAAVIGSITDDGFWRGRWAGRTAGELPVRLLTAGAPQRTGSAGDTIQKRSVPRQVIARHDRQAVDLFSHPEGCSAEFVYRQYDWGVQRSLLTQPGRSGAAVVHHRGSGTRVAFSLDGNSYYTLLDPYAGARAAVYAGLRKLSLVGAEPLGVTNCLNAGNPEKGNSYRQLSGMVSGLGDACRELGIPVTGGNVSLYNESAAGPVLPTPAIGMAGRVKTDRDPVEAAFAAEGDVVWLVGTTAAEFGGSLYRRLTAPSGWRNSGEACPAVDSEEELRRAAFIRSDRVQALLTAGTVLSRGGLLRAAALCATNGGRGFVFDRLDAGAVPGLDGAAGLEAVLWSETQGRYLVSVSADTGDEFRAAAEDSGIPVFRLGTVGGLLLDWFGAVVLPLRAVDDLFRTALEQELTGKAGGRCS